MTRQLSAQLWEVDGQELPMPVQIRDAAMAAAVYTCPHPVAAEILAGTPFTALKVAGRAVAVFICVQYRDGDLGVYDEFGVELLVRGTDRSIGMYTLDLPVTATFTRSAGRAIWGLPKFLVQGSIVAESRQTRVEISDGDDFILSGSVAGGVRIPGSYPVTASGWSVGLEGENFGSALRTVSRLRASGIRFRPGGRRLALGEHPMARRAREIGMGGRPLCSATISHARVEIANPI